MAVLPPLQLDARDLAELIRLSWDGELACTRRRAMILLDLHAGMLRQDLALKYSLNRDTVADTEKYWRERGYLSLYPMHGGGPQRKITLEACEALAEWASAEALNSSQLRAKLAEKFSINASAKVVTAALREQGFVWKRTRCWLKKSVTTTCSSMQPKLCTPC